MHEDRNNQDLNEDEESSHDADSNPCFDEISEDNPEDVLEPGVDDMKRAKYKANDLLAANEITSWILRQSQIYWRQAWMIAKHHEDRWNKLVSNWNPAISTKQKKGTRNKRKTDQEMGRRPPQLRTTRQIQQGQRRSHERHDLAHHGSRLKRPARPTTPYTTTATT